MVDFKKDIIYVLQYNCINFTIDIFGYIKVVSCITTDFSILRQYINALYLAGCHIRNILGLVKYLLQYE